MGASWASSARLAAFFVAPGRFLCVLDRSGLDFEVFWESSGGPRALFFEVFLWIWVYAGLLVALASDTQKPRKTLVFLRFSYIIRVAHKAKKRYKIAPGACRTKLPTKMVLQPGLGARWTRFWRGLGRSLVSLGRLWDAFGRFLAPLGRPWAGSWDLLGRSWASLGWSGPPLGWILGPRDFPSLDFGGSGDVLGRVLERFGVAFYDGF